ncbi:MAG: hypothetical protein GY765_18165 [bacterium]|nr:hypothetical protein [bacterium]
MMKVMFKKLTVKEKADILAGEVLPTGSTLCTQTPTAAGPSNGDHGGFSTRVDEPEPGDCMFDPF